MNNAELYDFHRSIKNFGHAANCKYDACSLSSCNEFKKEIQHQKKCKFSESFTCAMCNNIRRLRFHHERTVSVIIIIYICIYVYNIHVFMEYWNVNL